MTCPVSGCQYPDSECLLEMDAFADWDEDVVCAYEEADDDADPPLESVSVVVSPLNVMAEVVATYYPSGDPTDLAREILEALKKAGWTLTHPDL